MQLQVRPIVAWPGAESKYSIRSNFGKTYSATLTLLGREIEMLGGTRPVLELWVNDYDVRIDGELKGNSRPRKPGVVLYFESRHGALRYACDRFDDWHHNLLAIAKALEALRLVDRYGVGTGAEQYTGYKALPAGAIALGAGMTVDEAAAFVAEHAGHPWDAGDLLDGPGVPHRGSVERAYKLAARKLHPDTGGSDELFARLTEAHTVLTKGA